VIAGAPVLIGVALFVAALVVSRRPAEVEAVQVAREIDPPPPPPSAVLAPDVAEPGRVVLDLSQGHFTVRAAPAGSPIRLAGRYDRASYRLEESRESYGEIGWSYRVSLEPIGLLQRVVRHDSADNELELLLPPDVPIALEARIGTAQATLELGGLWIVSADLDLGVGSYDVTFDEPSRYPAGTLRIAGTIGELRVRELGNASPEAVEIHHRLGHAYVDLAGAWRRDAALRIACGLGECNVQVPDGVGLEVDSVGVALGESHVAVPPHRSPPEPGAPTLRLSVKGGIGKVAVD
jgi:hypothetical protein